MAASAAFSSNVVNVDEFSQLVGTDYQNAAVLMQSGAIETDTRPLGNGTRSIGVRRQVWEGDVEGQSLAIDGEFSMKDVNDVQWLSPIIVRGDAASSYTLQALIGPDGVTDVAALAVQARAKIGQMIDSAAIAALEGAAAANTGNQSGSDTILTLPTLNTARFVRGDVGNMFQNGVIVLRSELMATAMSLGLVAATSNTWGIAGANIALNGMVPTIQGMFPYVTNKLSLSSTTSHYAYLLEKGALIFRGSEAPIVQISDIPKGMGYYFKFTVRFAIGVKGMTWGGAASDEVTNAELRTSGNWTLAASAAKLVPVVRFETDDD